MMLLIESTSCYNLKLRKDKSPFAPTFGDCESIESLGTSSPIRF